MPDQVPPAQSGPPSVPPRPPPVAGKRRWLLYGCGGLLALVLIIVGAAALTVWWLQRPIKPVVLKPKEQAVVQQKLNELEQAQVTPDLRHTNNLIQPPEHGTYVPGAKQLTLTEREVNGLLNQNTDLGRSVRLEFARDAINAYVAVPIPQDFPIAGGKMFRARARLGVSLGNAGTPYVVLEDVTVFGVSLPKAWLGGLKGENLLGDAVGQGRGGPLLRGIKSLRVEPGALVLQLED